MRVPVAVGDNSHMTVAMPLEVGWANPSAPGTYEFGVYSIMLKQYLEEQNLEDTFSLSTIS